MPKHIVFLLHGIGVHDKSRWAEEPDGPIATLNQVSAQYGYFKAKPLDQRVEFAPLHYDEIFCELVEQWQADSQLARQWDPTGVLADTTAWLAHCGEKEKNFWWTHCSDVALYRLCANYRQRVRSHVIDLMAARIERAMSEEGAANCSILAHSMGTAVAHDCMHLLGTVRWGGHANALNPAHWRFNQVFMIANVSRCLQSEDAQMAKAYQSIVRPGPVEDPGSYCASYWNIRHEADPVAFVRRFDPVGWRNYTNIVVNHYHEYNIHGFSHHLLNPRVHIPILRKLTTPRAVSPEEEIAAVNPDNFPQFGGDLAFIDKAKSLHTELEQLKVQLGEDASVKDWMRGLIAFSSKLEIPA